MQNWKIALLSTLLFTFVALPAIGQEMDVPSLKKLDPLTWSSEILLAEEEEVEVHAISGDKEEESVHEVTSVHSMAGDHEEAPEENWLLHFLRNVFSSAMSF